MKAARIIEAKQVVVREQPEPRPSGDDVVVEMKAAPICGSDLHGLYEKPGEKPFVPGHEGAGIVVAVDRTRRLKVGDRVCLVSAVYPCGSCTMCRSGRSIYCRESKTYYGSGMNGTHARFALLSELSLERIPDWMSCEQASLILDPIGTPHHAYRRMGTNASHTVGVFGLGPMGLGAVSVGAFLGAQVIAIDPIAFRRTLALALGAAAAIDPRQGDVAEQVRDQTHGHGLDHALECSGNASALESALDLVHHFGHVALVGESRRADIKPSEQFLRKEITLSGSTCFPIEEFPQLVRLFERGLKGEKIITHRFGIEEAARGYALFSEGNTGKVVFAA